MKYYFSPSIKQLLQQNKRYYWLDDNSFSIVDEESGNTIKRFEVRADSFFLDTFSQVLMFLNVEKTNLTSYDLDGNQLSEIELSSQMKKMFIFWNNKCYSKAASVSLLDLKSLDFYQS